MLPPAPRPDGYRRTRTRERAQFLADVLVAACEGPIVWWADTAHLSRPDPEAEIADAMVTVIDRDTRDAYPISIEEVAAAVWRITSGKITGLSGTSTQARRIWHAQRANDTSTLATEDYDLIAQVAVFRRFEKGTPDD